MGGAPSFLPCLLLTETPPASSHPTTLRVSNCSCRPLPHQYQRLDCLLLSRRDFELVFPSCWFSVLPCRTPSGLGNKAPRLCSLPLTNNPLQSPFDKTYQNTLFPLTSLEYRTDLTNMAYLGKRQQYDTTVDDDDGNWWYSNTAEAIKWAVVAGIFFAVLLFFIGGHIHAKRRVRKGQ